MLAGAMVCIALGFGVGWGVFSWQPWRSSVNEHDAEVAVLKATRLASATCGRREYPTTMFDCSARTANGCADIGYNVRLVAGRFDIERIEGNGRSPLVLPPLGC
jgi:hypothetical protein